MLKTESQCVSLALSGKIFFVNLLNEAKFTSRKKMVGILNLKKSVQSDIATLLTLPVYY